MDLLSAAVEWLMDSIPPNTLYALNVESGPLVLECEDGWLTELWSAERL